MRFVNFLRWIIAIPFIVVLFAVMIAGVPATAVSGIARGEDAIKSYLKKSGIYENFIEVALQAASKQFQGEGTAFFKEWERQIKDKESDLGKLALKVADPNSLEEKAETVIHSLYAWLGGETERPTFEIAILENKKDFINLLSIAFREKARSLPECGADFTMPENFNPLEIPCWPAGFGFNTVDKFIAENSNRPELDQLFAKAKFNSKSIEISPETTAKVQQIFSIIQSVPMIFLAALILLSLLLLLIVPRFSRGLKTTGIVILVSSLLLVVGRIFTAGYFDNLVRLIEEKAQIGSTGILSDILENLLGTIYFDILGKATIYSVIGIAAGILLIITSRFFRQKQIV